MPEVDDLDETVADQVIAEEFNRIRGKLCGLIESWGLPERQERGAVGTFKALSYDAEARVKRAVRRAE